MKANKPIAQIDIENNVFHVMEKDLLPVALRSGFDEPNVNSAGVDFSYIKNYDKIIAFLSRRVLPIDRENAKKLLNAYHFT